MKLPAWMTRTRGRRIATAVGASLLVLVAVGWFVVRPIVARAVVTKMLCEKLGTRVEIDSASYAFGSSATIYGLRVYHPERDELLAEIDTITAQFEGSPLSTPDRIVRLDVEGVKGNAVREEDGTWNFEAVKLKSEGSMWIGEMNVNGVAAEFSRRGGPDRFVARVNEIRAKPKSAHITGFALDWKDAAGLDAVARAPSTRVSFPGDIAALDVIDEVVVENPEIWAGVTPAGKPELRERLKAVLGTGGKSDRVFIKQIRMTGGTLYGVMRTPDGQEWLIPVEALRSTIDWTAPAVFDVPLIEGKLCDGVFGASATVRLDEAADSEFQGRLDRVDMEKLAATTRFSKCRVRGRLSGSLKGWLRPSGDVDGSGCFKARDAYVWDLPVFQCLLSELGIKLPRDSKFDLMQADFNLKGDRIQFVDLKTEGGDTIDVRGEGRVRYDGTDLAINFWPRPINSDDVPIIGDVAEFFSGAVTTVELRGTILDFKVKSVEGFVDLIP